VSNYRDCIGEVFYFNICQVALLVVGFLFALWKIARVEDGFYYKEELFIQFIWLPIFLIILLVLTSVSTIPLYGLITWYVLGVFGSLLTSVCFPFGMSFQQFYRMLDSTKQFQNTNHLTEEEFGKMLNDPELFKGFLSFAVNLWSAENILFYTSVKRYEDMVRFQNKKTEAEAAAGKRRSKVEIIGENMEENKENKGNSLNNKGGSLTKEKKSQMLTPKEIALSIRDDFLLTGSFRQVNLDEPIKLRILERIAKEEFTEGLFAEARGQVFKLLKFDTFAKWKFQSITEEKNAEPAISSRVSFAQSRNSRSSMNSKNSNTSLNVISARAHEDHAAKQPSLSHDQA